MEDRRHTGCLWRGTVALARERASAAGDERG